MIDRRTVIKGAAALGGMGVSATITGSLFPRAMADATGGGRRILIALELTGGNDGLNTVIPYGDDSYYRLRPNIGVRPAEVLKLDAHWGLNPGMGAARNLWHEGQLAIIHGCGNSKPSFSHAAAAIKWHCELFGDHAGEQVRGINRPDTLSVPAADDLPRQLARIANAVIDGRRDSAYHIRFGSHEFDTHARQPDIHMSMLNRVDAALQLFLESMERHRLSDRVAVLIFSEFGRTAVENNSLGTDHGHANVVLFAGKSVRGGHYGQPPSLTELDAGRNLSPTTEVRQVSEAVSRLLG